MRKDLNPFVALEGSGVDTEDDAIILDFSDADRREYRLRLKQACLGALILSLLARARQRAATLGRHSEEQPLQLLDATALAFEGGQVGLQLALENDLRVSFVLGSQGLANLRSALASLDDISRKPDPGAKPH